MICKENISKGIHYLGIKQNFLHSNWISKQEKKLSDNLFIAPPLCVMSYLNGYKAGMSNWRPAGRMRPHCLFNAARRDLFCYINDRKLLKYKEIRVRFHNKSNIIHLNLNTYEYFMKKFHLKSLWNINKINNFFNCGPQSTFLTSKLLLRPAQCFEFDMPATKVCIGFIDAHKIYLLK